MKIRAIRIENLKDKICPVFELNEKTKEFVMLGDMAIKYSLEIVEEDDDFLVCQVEHDVVNIMTKHQLKKYSKALEDEKTKKTMTEVVHKNAEALKKLSNINSKT